MSDTFLIYLAKYFSISRFLGLAVRHFPEAIHITFGRFPFQLFGAPLRIHWRIASMLFCVSLSVPFGITSPWLVSGAIILTKRRPESGLPGFTRRKGGAFFFVGCTPNIHQLCKRVSCDQAKISLLSASVTGGRVAAFVKDLPLYGG